MNDLLAALPADAYTHVTSHLTLMPLSARQLLHKRDEPLTQIVFPGRALCSLVVSMEDGATAEVALVGAEGMIGVEALLGQQVAACDATVQIAGDGEAWVMSIDAFRAELEQSPAFKSVVTTFAQSFLRVLVQSVACNALHNVDARCCRWLLHAQDRLATNALPLTHDLISTMLGVRRPTVTLLMNSLMQDAAVSASRGMIRIIDRETLESRACECYRATAGTGSRRLSAERRQSWPPAGRESAEADCAKLVAGASVS